MSKKYVIEIKPEYEDKFKGVMILGAENGNLYVDSSSVEELEELNSDYINEHFGDLQDTAYQRGLKDAWEAARKIIRMSDGDILDLFPDCYASVCTAVQVILKYDASEAIAKLKAYEEKQKADDPIIVGDEVKAEDGTVVFFVTWMSDRCICGVDKEGKCYSYEPEEICGKTGRHFDIEKLLEAMKA